MVEQAGSLAGFAAVIGLAVLSALYFSQARDLRRLREWAGRAPERAAEGVGVQSPVPGRVVAQPQRPPQPQAGTPAATNGDAAPAVAAGKPESEQQAEGDKKEGDGAKPADAKPGMPAPASAAAAGAAAAASAGAGAASVTGPAAPSATPSASGGPSGSAAAPPKPDAPESAPGAGSTPGSGSATPGSGSATPGSGSGSPQGGPGSPAAGAPKPPTPQRPPGSVLPPRTGTLPPVRRLPSAQTGPSPAATGVLGQAPQKKQRNPLYVVLAIVGVLVLGAAAAIGVPAIVNGTKNKNNKSTSSKTAQTTTRTRHRVTPATSTPSKITVAVLNGTSIPGLAAQIGDRVDADGFTLGTVSNASPGQGQRANSVAMYASGHQSDAKLVAKKLGIKNVQAIDSSSQQIAGDATVVVIVGSDKTQ